MGTGGLLLLLAAQASAPSNATTRDAWLGVLEDLASEVSSRRVKGAERAGSTRSAFFVHPLRSALKDDNPAVRVAAATALGELGVPDTSSELFAIIDALEIGTLDKSEPVALAAVAALARFPFPSVRQRVEAVAKEQRRPASVRKAAANALKAPPTAEASRRFQRYLQMTAREASGVVPDDGRGQWPLLFAARDLLSPRIAIHADATDRIAAHEDLTEARPFLVRAARSKDSQTRIGAVVGLARDPAAEILPRLLRLLRDREPRVRVVAIDALGNRPSDEVAEALALHLSKEPDAKLRVATSRAIAKQPEVAMIRGMRPWVSKQSKTEAERSARRLAIGLLSSRTSTSAAYLLVDLFATARTPSVVRAATEALDRRKDRQVVPRLLGHLARTKPNAKDRAHVMAALAKRPDPRISEALLDLVEAGRARTIVVSALAERSEAEVRPRLLRLVVSSTATVRAPALAAIADFKGADVSEALAASAKAHPDDDTAFDLLLAQDRAETLEDRITLLESEEHRRRHRVLLDTIRTDVDQRIPAAVVGATKSDPKLAPIALEVLERQEPTKTLDALYQLASTKALDDKARALAVRRMAGVAAPDVEKLLRPLANDPVLDVRMSARNALHELAPQTYPAWDPYGRVPLVVGGAAFGSTMMLLSAEIADAELSPAFTGGVGMLLGGATPFLLTLGEDVTLGDAGYFGTMGMWGTLGGYGLGKRLGLERRDTLWVTVAGEAAGVAAGAFAMKQVEWGIDEVVLSNVTAVESGVLAAGITALIRRNADDRARSAFDAALVGGAIGTATMPFLARRLEVKDDFGLIGTTMAHGAWLGAWAPLAFTGEDGAADAAAGVLVGQSAGYLVGLGVSQFVDLDPQTAAFSGLGAATGAAALGGLALSLDVDGRTGAWMVQGGSVAGALALAVAGPYLEWNENDRTLAMLGIAGGAIAGGQFSVRAEEGTFGEKSFPGGMLLGAGVGTAVGIAASQLVDVTDRELYTTIGGAGLLGVGGTGLGYLIPNLDVRQRSNVSGAGILLGAALTYPFADDIRLDGPDLLYASSAASLGGLYGAFSPVYANDDDAPSSEVAGGLTFGSAVGFYAGALTSQWLDMSTGEVGLTAFSSAAASGVGAGLGLVIPSADERATVAMMQGAGAATFAVMSGLVAGDVIRLNPGGRDPGGTLVSHVAALGAHGAWHGGLIPYMHRDDTPASSEVAGGVLLGTSVGTLGGLALAGLADRPLDGPSLLEASLLGVAANGLGGGLGLVADDRRLGASLMQGLGLTGYAGALALAPHTDYDDGAPATFLAGAATLGWLGTWAPLISEDAETSQVIGGAMAGTSAGVIGAVALASLVDERDDLELVLGTATGSGLGAGLRMMVSDAERHETALALEIGGAVGLGTALTLFPYTEYTTGDKLLALYGTSAGATLGGFAPALWKDEPSQTQYAGGSLFGASLGAATTMAVSQFVDPEPEDVFELTYLTAAAGSIGGGVAMAANDLDRRERALAIEIAGLGGVTLAAVLAPYTRYDSEQALFAATAVGVAGAHAYQLPALWQDEPTTKSRAGTAMAAAGAGAIAGAVVSQIAPVSAESIPESLAAMAAFDAFAYGFGRLAFDDPGARAAMFAASGVGAYTLGLALAPFTDFSGADYVLLGLGTTIGAWHGAWVPSLSSGEVRDEDYGAGAAAGAGAGFLAAAVASQFIDVHPGAQVHGAAGWVTGSALGAGLGLLVPSFDRPDTIALMQGGGAVGLGAGIALAGTLSYDEGGALLVPVGALAGAAAGLTLPALVLDPSEEIDGSARAGGVLLGAGLGAVAGASAAQLVDLEADDVAEASGASVLGAATGLGLGLLIPGTDRRTRYALMDGAGVAGLGLGIWLAPKTNLDEDAYLSMGLGGVIGGAAAGFTPVLFNGPDLGDVPGEQVGGAVLAGFGVGAATGLLLDQTLELDGIARKHAAYGAGAGGLAGAGIGLVASEDDRLFAALAQGLSVAGAVGVGATAREIDYTAGDLALGSAYVGYLTWHSLGLTLLLDGTDRQAGGVVMTTAGLGALTGMYLAPYIDLSMSDILMLLAGNVWGTWIGGWGGAVLRERIDGDFDGRRGAGLTLLTSVIGSDVGLTVTGMVVGGLLDVEPTRFAVINLSGLGGMMIGMLAAGFAKDEPLRTGNVVGSLGGLVAGAIVTSFFDWKTSPTWDQILGSDQEKAAAAVTPRGPSKLGVEAWYPSARVEPTDDGGQRYLFEIGGTWH